MPFNKHLRAVVYSICWFLPNSNAISNTNFNASIREYTTYEDVRNLTNAKTLQKEDTRRYANFSPNGNLDTLKEIPDNVLSSSSHSRGLLHHEVPEYVINGYEESPHQVHGYDYHSHNEHHEPHSYKHHYDHYDSGYHVYPGHHHSDHGHHYEPHNHALAAKTLLWPIAGIALLGAAAALVNNPILLQLGVVSGRRKRNTEETSTEYTPNLNIWTNNIKDAGDSNEVPEDGIKKRMFKWNLFKDGKHGVPRKTRIHKYTQTYKIGSNFNTNDENDRFIPIPLIYKNE